MALINPSLVFRFYFDKSTFKNDESEVREISDDAFFRELVHNGYVDENTVPRKHFKLGRSDPMLSSKRGYYEYRVYDLSGSQNDRLNLSLQLN